MVFGWLPSFSSPWNAKNLMLWCSHPLRKGCVACFAWQHIWWSMQGRAPDRRWSAIGWDDLLRKDAEWQGLRCVLKIGSRSVLKRCRGFWGPRRRACADCIVIGSVLLSVYRISFECNFVVVRLFVIRNFFKTLAPRFLLFFLSPFVFLSPIMPRKKQKLDGSNDQSDNVKIATQPRTRVHLHSLFATLCVPPSSLSARTRNECLWHAQGRITRSAVQLSPSLPVLRPYAFVFLMLVSCLFIFIAVRSTNFLNGISLLESIFKITVRCTNCLLLHFSIRLYFLMTTGRSLLKFKRRLSSSPRSH